VENPVPQTKSEESSETNSMKGFSIAANPLGLLQFGPIIHGQIGLTDNLVLDLHLRLPSMGLLTSILMEETDTPDQLSGRAIGGGLLYFFGDKQNKPYLGGLVEFHQATGLFEEGNLTGEWESYQDYIVVVVNGGYRFRFDSGFFMNTGAFLGAAAGEYNWDYTNQPRGGNEESEFFPFGMLELSFGIQF